MNSPYTHPSMPGTPPMDLSAALEDAEGQALVDAIHDPSNPRLRNTMQVRINGNWVDPYGPFTHGIEDLFLKPGALA